MFLDKGGKPLYIGRTVSLRKRVLSYFRNEDVRLSEMVSLAKKINHKKTDTLLEAVILEANLIKKHWPKYNVREKDNRSFVYFVIPKTEYPEPVILRKRELDKFPKKAWIFGPYQSQGVLDSALKIIRRIFPYSTCLPAEAAAKAGKAIKPCFDYQIGRCPGLCIGAVSKEDYQKNIRSIVMMLSGDKKRLIKRLRKDNPNAARALKHIQDVALIGQENILPEFGEGRIEGYDISHLTGRETYGSMVVFKNGKADKNDYRLFKIREAPAHDDLRALEEVLIRRLKHREWPYPDLVMIDGGKPQIDFVSRVFKKKRANIPFVGISKFGGDKLVYPAKTTKNQKALIESIKKTLIEVREEAHRFSLKSSRHSRRIK